MSIRQQSSNSRFFSLASILLVFVVAREILVTQASETNHSAGQQASILSSRAKPHKKRSDGNETVLLHEREFVSPQLRIQMDCRQDETTIKANFSRPFNGIFGVGNLAATKCKLVGSGEKYYELHVPHNATQSCDAKWDEATSSIGNTLFIRFHQTLETGSDIAKNVLCRLAVGNLVVGKRPSQLKKQPRSLQSPIIRGN